VEVKQMVVSQTQLNKALEEINSSYSKLLERLATLEAKVNKQGERPKTSTSTSSKNHN
jgi:hypothetical protein